MKIRTAVLSDAKALAEFGARTFEIAFGPFNAPQDLQDYLKGHYGDEIQRGEIADSRIITLVVEAQHDLIGFLQLRLDSPHPSVGTERPIELWRIYVDPTQQSKGVGKKLIESAQQEAVRKGGTALWLSVWQENTRAIAFYRKQGFEIVGEKDFWVGNDQQFDFVMRLMIPPD